VKERKKEREITSRGGFVRQDTEVLRQDESEGGEKKQKENIEKI
jgi:hypothetical protein